MHDVVIIGAGPAGLTAALYASRAGLTLKIIESMATGGQMLLTEHIDNFPGFIGGVSSRTLVENIAAQLKDIGVTIDNDEIIGVAKDSSFRVKTSSGKELSSKAVIVATGARYKQLGIPGEERLSGRGVSYCAICDAPLFKKRRVVVIGGGNSAAEEAFILARVAQKVTVVHRRDQLRAVKILQERLLKNPAIEIMWDTVPLEFLGENKLESLRVKNVKTQKETTVSCEGAFVSVGLKPNTDCVKNIAPLDENGYIITDDTMAASVAGLFACGDCRVKNLRQIVTACSDGATAAHSVFQYLETR